MNQKGFTLFEIMVALLLVASIFLIVPSFTTQSRDHLDSAMNALERVMRYGKDQAVLENKIVRLHLFLDETPQTFKLEIGSSSDIILPSVEAKSVKTKEEKDAETAAKRKFDGQFSVLPEFEGDDYSIEEAVKIVAVGGSLDRTLITDYHAFIYFFPSGEQDGAQITLATEDEISSLTLDPFSGDFDRSFHAYENINEKELAEYQIDLATKLFNEWLGKKP